MGDEESELKKIAARAPESDLAYATDEDLFLNHDPQVNQWDLGSDPCQFARERLALTTDLMKNLDAKVVKDGESWSRNRRAFSTLLNQYGNAAELTAAYIGGQSVNRDHKGDKGGRDPVVPVAGAKQRECLNFLVENILSDRSFQFSPALLRRLATEKWTDWSSNMGMEGVDYPVLQRILAIQRIALGSCLNGSVLARLQNQELQADPNADPLRMDEVFRSLTDGIWSELDAAPAAQPKDKDAKARTIFLTTIRRNLQREHLRRLGGMVLGERNPMAGLGDQLPFVMLSGGGSVPADARALARMHLKQLGDRIEKFLAKDGTIDDTSRAHLEECRQRINKVLDSSLNANEP